MTSTQMPADARAFDDLDNNGFLRITNALSIILNRGDLNVIADIKQRTLTINYRTGAVNKFDIGHCVLCFPSEVLHQDVLEDFEITVDKNIVVMIERQYSSAATFQRIAGAIESIMYKM